MQSHDIAILSNAETIGELPTYDFQVSPNCSVEEVINELEENVEIPGVIICEGEAFRGVVSRRTLFEMLSLLYGNALFRRKSIQTLHRNLGIDHTVMPADLAIQSAVQQALGRSIKKLYEPIVVEEFDAKYRLLDMQVLLLAQSQMLDRANKLIHQQIQSGKALASSLKVKKVLKLILDRLGDFLDYDLAEILILEEEGLKRVASRGRKHAKAAAKPKIHPTTQEFYDQILQTRQPQTSTSKLNPPSNTEHCVCAGIPLLHAKTIVGILTLVFFDKASLRPQELEIVQSFASQAAIALQNSLLFEEVNRLATTDPLTKVFNRYRFFQLAEKEYQRAERYKHPFSIVMLDVDHFKRVNDRYGHLTGDRVLVAIANRCQATLREVDVMGRYGGEEFIILLPETGLDGAFQLAERLRMVIAAAPMAASEQEPTPVTVSLGVACTDQNENPTPNLLEIISRADQALYQSKNSGRNRTSIWEDSGRGVD